MDGEFFSAAPQTTGPRVLGNRVLLIAASHTGNNVFCTPAIRLLKRHYPQTIFDVVALNRVSAEVLKGNPDIGHCHIADRAWQLGLIARRYDSVVCLHPKSQHLMRGLKHRLYVLPAMVEGQHHADQMLGFASNLAGATLADRDRAYVLPPVDAASRVRIDAHLDTPDGRYVGLHLGCGRTSIHGWKFFYKQRATHPKLWPADRYTELARRLVEADPAIRIVLTGTRNESFLAKQLVSAVPGTVNLIGKTGIRDLHHLMHRLSLFIAHDCGVMHIAAATSVPMISLFGPTDPVFTGPYPPQRNQGLIRRDSMEAITVEDVLQAALGVIAARA